MSQGDTPAARRSLGASRWWFAPDRDRYLDACHDGRRTPAERNVIWLFRRASRIRRLVDGTLCPVSDAASTGDSAGAYDFTALGWLQFERVCSGLVRALCGTSESAWTGAADRARRVMVDGDAARPLVESHPDVPVECRVVWMPRCDGTSDAARWRVHSAM